MTVHEHQIIFLNRNSKFGVHLKLVDELMLVAESHRQSADFEQLELTDFIDNCVVYNVHRLFFLALDYDSIQFANTRCLIF